MKTIRIGTRDSELALWQANKVRKMLEELGYQTQIIPIKSTGDIVLDKPLYEFGITGVFTRNLDVAMLNGDIDIAVHSMKDVPTVLPQGIVQVGVLKRAKHEDILVLKDTEEFLGEKHAVIATGSLRRKAQWLNRYPTHKVEDLRGNVQTRLQKLNDSEWGGAIFAAAGLERIGLRPEGAINLSWMIPAPAQGAIMVTALENDDFVKEACEKINDADTELCTKIERDFLHLLEGGCTAPIGALAYINHKDKEVVFTGILLSRNGQKKIEVYQKAHLGRHDSMAQDCANYIIERGGKMIMAEDEDLQKEFSVFSTKTLSKGQKKLFPTNVSVDDSDFIKIRFNRIASKVVSQEIDNVVITSQNAVEGLLQNFTKEELNFKNIYCVGRRTKRLIEQKIGKVTHSAKNAKFLATYLAHELEGKEVTYFCSNLRLDTIPTILQSNGIIVNEIEVYKTMYSPKKVDEHIKGVLFYSPSTVESFMQENKADKIAFCIGESTAKEAQKHFEKVEIAKIPTVESVIEMVGAYFVK